MCISNINQCYKDQIQMGEMSELQAYKQLLQVTQNILNELTPEQQIVKKYLTLKKSILAKVKPQHDHKSFSTKILHSYKLFTKNMIESITQFQSQIEGEMNKDGFLKNTHRMMKQVQKQCRMLSQELSNMSEYKQNKNLKLIIKEQINSFKFLCKEFEGKIENMGLMLEVHRKMHEIILQASEKQAKTTQKQIQYNRRLSQMQNAVEQINDVKKFIQSFEITEKKARRFELARKNLAKVLFDI